MLSNLRSNVDLFSHTTLRMKSTAQYFFEARSREDLIAARKYSLEKKIPFLILGGGSNVAILKKNLQGLIVKNLYMKKETLKEDENFVELLVSSGYPVSKLVNETVEAGYEGVEYHQGLPGSVGGAIYMNSKWTKPECYFGDDLISAYLLTARGEIKKVDRDYFKFAYDYSVLQETSEILLEAIFRFKKTSPEILKKRATEALAYRKETQPLGVATSGCFFRNVDGESAGKLIDKAGLKGAKVGNFIVSPIHANFIINQGEGQPEDLKKLLQIIKNKVREKFGVSLKEEVVLVKSAK